MLDWQVSTHKLTGRGTDYDLVNMKQHDEGRDTKTILSVARAVDVLNLFPSAKSGDLGISEIHRSLGLSKAVIHRILTTFVDKGMVVSDEKTRRYRLGPLAIALGTAFIEHLDLRSLALPVLERLSTITNETATLSLRYGDTRVYVDQATPDREVFMWVPIGKPFPLHAGASSKAFLANLGDAFISSYIDRTELTKLTHNTISDPDALRADLRIVRESGYAISVGERQAGAASVAAPLFDHEGLPHGVISVCGPSERFLSMLETSKSLLLEETRALSQQLGYRVQKLGSD